MITDTAEGAARLAELMAGARTLALTGAGMSTDSGIPDYRGPGRPQLPSVYYDEFVADPVWQRWVWLRNEESWRSVANLEPTRGHTALAQLEARGSVIGVATQNVDALHTKAGSVNVAELHGTFARIACTGCGATYERDGEVGEALAAANPHVIPDSDPARAAVLASADREAAEACSFTLVPCPTCGGLLKPDITFFGESLPGAAMDAAMGMARRANVVLVAGSSLYVQTAVWVLREAMAHGAKLAIVNRGETAADSAADLRIEGGCSEVLGAVEELLGH